MVLTIFIFQFSSSFAAQVTGKVVDFGTKQAIDFANVSVLKPSDVGGQPSEQLVTGTITDATGAFTLELADGSYTIVVSFMGYSEQRKEITVAGKPLNIGRIQLKEDTQTLSEVEVVGQGSSMRFELDKKVFTVDQNIASAGASVTDVLENIPSIDVDQEGTISLRNSEDVEIWINGKPAGLNSENRGQVLQQMPAGTIEKIEVITNPSAKFSPEGTSGIINLVMKKDRSAGYYGSVQAGLDYALAAPWNVPPGANLGFNINFNAGPVDGYFNVGYRYHISNGGSKTDRYNLSGAGAQQLDSSLIQTHLLQEGTQTHRGGGLFARAGLNFRLAEGHTLGVSGFGMVSEPNAFKMTNSNHRTYLLTQPDGTILRDYTRDQNGIGSHPGGNATLDYTFEQNDELVIAGPHESETGKTNKVIAIENEIGRRPVLSFGNSSGDFAMLNYATANPAYPGLGFLVVADDTEREYGDEEKAASMRQEIADQGWVGISMRDDWTTIYGNGVEKTGLPAQEELAEAA